MSKNRLPPEDAEEWKHFSANIKPIKSRKLPNETPAKKLPKQFEQAALPPSFSSRPMPALKKDDKSGVDKNSFANLSKGTMPIDGKLDLHGKHFAQAFSIFKNFILKAATDGKRCVLVITGKGRPQAEKTLHDALPDWINDEEIRPFIITYTNASPKHGGTGAYTILLKRKRI